MDLYKLEGLDDFELKKMLDFYIKNGETININDPNHQIKNSYYTSSYYFYDFNNQIDIIDKDTPSLSILNLPVIDLNSLNIQLPEELTQKPKSTTISEPNIDFSKVNQVKPANENSIAVIIGNTNYQKTKKVEFAVNDARMMQEFLINTLGYKEGNIFYEEDLTKSGFEVLFGTKDDPNGKLANNIKAGQSEVLIFYSGHGAPSLRSNKGYFVPIDGDPNYIEQSGYSLDLFYQNLGKLNTKNLTIITDACFSGVQLFDNISPAKIEIENSISIHENCTIFSSSTGSQVSSWFNEKKEGLFTYYFLRAFQDLDKSDANKDNKLTYKEIADYVSDLTNGVPYMARKLHNVDQNPTIQGSGVNNVFVEFK
jgi:hypothetical protein